MSTDNYLKARKKALACYKDDVKYNVNPYLISLEEQVKNYKQLAQQALGLYEIPVRQIVGSVVTARAQSFARNFLPLLEPNTEFAVKWSHVDDYQQNEGIDDPIKVYEYNHKFYVLEGNKRVSVLKSLEMTEISAEVIRLIPSQNFPGDRLYKEFLTFFNVTHLYLFDFSKEGSYRKLAECLDQTLQTPWSEQAIDDLKSGYYRFDRIYKDMKTDEMMNCDDAFLVYLDTYSLSSLLQNNLRTIRRQIESLSKDLKKIDFFPQNIYLQNPNTFDKGFLSEMMTQVRYSVEHPLRIAFIHDDSATQSRWVHTHESGRILAEAYFKGRVKTVAYESVSPDDFDETTYHLIKTGIDVIVTTSVLFYKHAKRMAAAYPHVKWLNCSIHQPSSLIRTYYGRVYEVKFLMGMLAAVLADNHSIGYIADYPVSSELSNINAFAIGAAMIDPKAKVYLEWSSVHTDCEERLMAKGANIISGVDIPDPEYSSRQFGLYQYNQSTNDYYNYAMLIWHWDTYYQLIFDTILHGAWDKKNKGAQSYWWGLSSDVIDIYMSQRIPYSTQNLINIMKDGLTHYTIKPFSGELHSQNGPIQKSEALSDQDIVNMDWLNDNIVGSLPDWDSLSDFAKTIVSKVGTLIER